MRSGQIVTSPDGERWKVRRRWLDRPLPGLHRRFARRAGGSALEGGLQTFSAAEGGSILLAIAATIVVGLAILLLLPLIGIALELAVLFALLSSGIVGRVLLRRPWVIEAVNLDDPQRSAAFAVRGWRRHEEAIETLKREITATGAPTPPAGGERRVQRMRARRAMVALTTAGIIWACAVSAAAAMPNSSAHASVVGGHPASIAEFPSAAFIAGGRGAGAFFCTGTVVAPRVVLTAGHCAENIESLTQNRIADFRVTTGVADVRHPPGANVSKVTAALAYPGFNPSNLLGDAGLLILAQPVAAPPIPLASPAAPVPLETGTPLAIPGWGLTDLDDDPPKVLQSGEIAAQSPLYCKRHSKEIVDHYSNSLQICGVDLPNEKVANCYGDSGGPALARRPDGTQVEVGIVSTGGPFCDPDEVNIFTRVEAVADWVQAWIATVEAGAPPPLEPKARLPRMTIFRAAEFYEFTFFEVLGNRYIDGDILRGGCHRLDPSKARCEQTWRLKGTRFHGSVTSSWAIQHNQVVLRGSYVVRTVGPRCIAGPHPKRCPVHTLRG